MGPKFGAQKGNKLGSQLGPMSITKLSPNWACQMGPIHCINFLLSGEAPDTVTLVSIGVLQPSMHTNELAVHDNYKAVCVKANVLSLGRAQRTILLLRDSGALQSIASQGQL